MQSCENGQQCENESCEKSESLAESQKTKYHYDNENLQLSIPRNVKKRKQYQRGGVGEAALSVINGRHARERRKLRWRGSAKKLRKGGVAAANSATLARNAAKSSDERKKISAAGGGSSGSYQAKRRRKRCLKMSRNRRISRNVEVSMK